MSARPTDDRLTEILKLGDPLADDPGPSPDERARMRRTVLAEAAEPSPPRWLQLSPALSVALLLALALGVSWWPSASERSRPPSLSSEEVTVRQPSVGGSPYAREAGNALENRKIQFETPGGTLVVWVLNPNFPS